MALTDKQLRTGVQSGRPNRSTARPGESSERLFTQVKASAERLQRGRTTAARLAAPRDEGNAPARKYTAGG